MSMSAPIPVAQNQVPMITELLEKLGFESMNDRQPLQASAHKWRRAYKCRDGTCGKDLTDWKSAGTQGKLRLMTEEYLEHAENGKKFWPKRAYAKPSSALEWVTDSRRITMLMQQLFWRQNVNEIRNAKNPARQHSVGARSVSSSDGSSIVFTKPWHAQSSARKASHAPQQDHVLNSLASRAGRPPSTIHVPSRLGSSINKPQNNTNPSDRSIEDVMKGSTEPTTVSGENNVNDVGKAAVNDIFAFHGSDEEGAREIASEPGPSSPVPVAKMVSETGVPRDPNFAFDAEPSAKSKKTEKAQNPAKTPKKRKRVRRIGSRVGSEDDDETYTPSKPKQKRTTSPKSAASARDSGSSKSSEKTKAIRPDGEVALPPEGDSLRRGSLSRRRRSFYDSENLMERFNASRQLLKSPNILDLSQEPLASASQSQRTVDVAQQYPDMVEHMHTFPAELQVASMSPTRVSTGAKPTVQETPSWLPPSTEESYDVQQLLLKQHNEARAASIAATRETSIPAQRRAPSVERTMTEDQEMHANELQPSRPNNMAERSRPEFPQHAKSPTPLFIPATDFTQSTYLRMSSSDQTPTEKDWSKAWTAPIAETHAIVKTTEIERNFHQNETSRAVIPAEQTEREREAQTARSLPTPTSDAPTTAPRQATNSNTLATTNQQPPTSKPSLQVRYWIVESRVPEFNLVKWNGGGLLGKSMETLCSEISALIGRPVLRSVNVNLKTSEGNVRAEIHCDKPETFTELQEDFAQVIKRHKKKGNTMFEITLEPDPSARTMMSTGGVVEVGDEDSDVEF